jgi:hypothetical protein
MSGGLGQVQRDVLDFLRSRENAGLGPVTMEAAAWQAFGRRPSQQDRTTTLRAMGRLTADGLVVGYWDQGARSGRRQPVYRYIGPR